MSQLVQLKSAGTLADIARLLGFKTSALAYILYKKDRATQYIEFEIPKRNGGTRQISSPTKELKLLQRRLAELLQNCVEEINTTNGTSDNIAHGFKRKRSILTNAKAHRNRRYVFNVDLSDFFGTINFGRVRGFFIKDRNFELAPSIATVIAQIACHKNALPQGSPCSPVISNLVGHVLDVHLVRLASASGCTYSRYADDLTFSTNKPGFPTNIASRSSVDDHVWLPGSALAHLVYRCGFEINDSKTRMQYRDSRQEVTGLIVNRKINVRCEYRRMVRAMVHHLFTKGTFHFPHKEDGTLGLLPGRIDQLHGMLGFIDGIDLYNKNGESEKTQDKQNLSTKESMYRRFLLFKEFYTAPRPVLLAEGKTDNIYLLQAIRSLAKAYPSLASIDKDGTIKLLVRIFKYSNTSTGRILGLHGGTGELSRFMHLYKKESKKFKASGGQQPIIIVVDNDSGAKEKGKIYNAVKDISGTKMSGHEDFVHVTGNLYLVATPVPPGKTDSKMEDFFDQKTKDIPINGKSFNDANDLDTDTQYGKYVFAEKVVRAQAEKIDFSKFDSILTRISAVIDAHKAKTSSI